MRWGMWCACERCNRFKIDAGGNIVETEKNHNEAREEMSRLQIAADDLVNECMTWAKDYLADLVYWTLSDVIQGRKSLRANVNADYVQITIARVPDEINADRV